MEYEKDYYLVILERHSKHNSAVGFVAKKLYDWVVESPERMLYKEEAVEVFYYYYSHQNEAGLHPFMMFAAQHDIPSMTLTALADEYANGVVTPWDLLIVKEHKKIEFTTNVAAIAETKKLLEVYEPPTDERKDAIVRRLRRKLQKRNI
jgi:hypothetical protein